MDICPEEPFPREKPPSIIEIKNNLRLGHSECCNCCCCKVPQFKAYKYIQPERPKSFRPIRRYDRVDVPMEGDTTYRLSFWPGPSAKRKPIIPESCLTVADGEFANDTTQKMSYLGNWCIKPQKKILPCVRSLFGRGPIPDKTTQKLDYTWKYGPKNDPIKYKGSLCLPRGHVEDNTTYKLSYFESTCRDEPVKSFAPIRVYEKNETPVEDCTTYRLSFFPNEPLEKEKHPWKPKYLKYEEPTTPVECCTTYKLSYWPQCPESRGPVKQKSADNLLNKTTCIEDTTTYNLSYFGGDGDRPDPILPSGNLMIPDCPISHDTTNRMSYLGNWCPKPEKAIMPCTRQLLGRGPVQDKTTMKVDFPWKCSTPRNNIKPRNNLIFSPAPVECCTTNRLSFLPNCGDCLMPNKSFAPIRKHEPSDVAMDLDTTMQLSYQPFGDAPKAIDKPWARQPEYHPPTTKIDDNTTYEMSFMPPGMLVPCCPECSDGPCSSPCKSCSTSMRPQLPPDTRTCVSC